MTTSLLFLAQLLGVMKAFTGRDISDDRMYVTGFLTILPALWLALNVERRLAEVLRQLGVDHLVEPGAAQEAPEVFVARRMRAWRIRGGLIVGAVVLAGFLFFYVGGLLDLAEFCQGRGFPGLEACLQRVLGHGVLAHFLPTGIFVTVAAAFGFLTGNRLGALAASSSVALWLSSKTNVLHLIPDHPDGMGGFRRLGAMIGFNGFLAAVPVVWLGVWLNAIGFSISEGLDGLRNWYWPFAAQFIVALVFFNVCFLVPAVVFTRRFGGLKESELARAERALQTRLAEGAGRDAALYARIESIRSLPGYPIGGRLAKPLAIWASVPFFVGAVQIFFQVVEDDPRFRAIGDAVMALLKSVTGL